MAFLPDDLPDSDDGSEHTDFLSADEAAVDTSTESPSKPKNSTNSNVRVGKRKGIMSSSSVTIEKEKMKKEKTEKKEKKQEEGSLSSKKKKKAKKEKKLESCDGGFERSGSQQEEEQSARALLELKGVPGQTADDERSRDQALATSEQSVGQVLPTTKKQSDGQSLISEGMTKKKKKESKERDENEKKREGKKQGRNEDGSKKENKDASKNEKKKDREGKSKKHKRKSLEITDGLRQTGAPELDEFYNAFPRLPEEAIVDGELHLDGGDFEFQQQLEYLAGDAVASPRASTTPGLRLSSMTARSKPQETQLEGLTPSAEDRMPSMTSDSMVDPELMKGMAKVQAYVDGHLVSDNENVAGEADLSTDTEFPKFVKKKSKHQRSKCPPESKGNTKVKKSKSNTSTTIYNAENRPTGGMFTNDEKEKVEAYFTNYRLQQNPPLSYDDLCKRVWANNRAPDDFWEGVGSVLPTRSKASIYKYVRRKYHIYEVRAKWNDAEDDKTLERLVKEKGTQWKLIGEEMERMPEDCRDRWRNYIKCGEARGQNAWTNEEEEQLRDAVNKQITDIIDIREREGKMPLPPSPDADQSETAKQSGEVQLREDLYEEINWTAISEMIGGKRSRIQCRYKWNKMKKWPGEKSLWQLKRDAALAIGIVTRYARKRGIEAGDVPVKSKKAKAPRKRTAKGPKMLVGDSIWFLKQMRNQKVVSSSDIDWSVITASHPDHQLWSADDYRATFEKLANGVPGAEHMSLQQIIDHVLEEFEDIPAHLQSARYRPPPLKVIGARSSPVLRTLAPAPPVDTAKATATPQSATIQVVQLHQHDSPDLVDADEKMADEDEETAGAPTAQPSLQLYDEQQAYYSDPVNRLNATAKAVMGLMMGEDEEDGVAGFAA